MTGIQWCNQFKVRTELSCSNSLTFHDLFHDLSESSMIYDDQCSQSNVKTIYYLRYFPTLWCTEWVLVLFIGTKTGFLIHSLLFQLLICWPFYSSQKVYNIAFTSLPWLVSTPISWLSRPGKWNYRIPWLSRFSMTHTNCCAVWNLYHTLSGWTRNSSFSFSKCPCPASLIIIDPMSVELLIRRWSNKELSDWSIRKTSTRIRNMNSVQSLKLRSTSLWQR